jgi:hypothetical protein
MRAVLGKGMAKKRLHAVYLLSLWQAHTEGEPIWRAWLECPSTGERRGFATLDDLCGYIKSRVNLLEGALDAGPALVLTVRDDERPRQKEPPTSDQAPNC